MKFLGVIVLFFVPLCVFADTNAIDLFNRIESIENEQQSQTLNKIISENPDVPQSLKLYSRIFDLKNNYEQARAKENSFANRMLTALTVAATGIGGMELMQGLAEQSADKDADADMTAYIETMRCTYGDDKQVKAGPDEIELPGGNDEELIKLRNEYFALAADLKERKEVLGMKPGIESEVIMDRTSTGLYDDENIGIKDGVYGSLYRAKTGNETDQAKINESKDTSSKRVKGGGVAVGAGVVGGTVGNILINGKTEK